MRVGRAVDVLEHARAARAPPASSPGRGPPTRRTRSCRTRSRRPGDHAHVREHLQVRPHVGEELVHRLAVGHPLDHHAVGVQARLRRLVELERRDHRDARALDRRRRVQVKRFEAAGWNARRIDGHDPAGDCDSNRSHAKIRTPDADRLPHHDRLFGAPTKAGTAECPRLPARCGRDQGGAREARLECAALRGARRYSHAWRKAGATLGGRRSAHWKGRLAALRRRSGRSSSAGSPAASRPTSSPVRCAAEGELAAAPQEIASRIASELALESLVPAIPEMMEARRLTSPAPTTPAPRTWRRSRPPTVPAVSTFGRARARHGGSDERHVAARRRHPVSGTFLVFSDYCRPSIRLAALMGQRVIHVMTARFDPVSARTGRRTSRSSISRRCGRSRICWCSARRSRTRRSSAGRSRSNSTTVRACSRCPAENLPQLRPVSRRANDVRKRRRTEPAPAPGQGAGLAVRLGLRGVALRCGAEDRLADRASPPASSRCPASICVLPPDAVPARGDHRRCARQGRGRGRGAARAGTR